MARMDIVHKTQRSDRKFTSLTFEIAWALRRARNSIGTQVRGFLFSSLCTYRYAIGMVWYGTIRFPSFPRPFLPFTKKGRFLKPPPFFPFSNALLTFDLRPSIQSRSRTSTPPAPARRCATDCGGEIRAGFSAAFGSWSSAGSTWPRRAWVCPSRRFPRGKAVRRCGRTRYREGRWRRGFPCLCLFLSTVRACVRRAGCGRSRRSCYRVCWWWW